MNLFLRALFWLLEKLGRYEVLVDAFGRVIWHRYYLFYFERTDEPRWIDYLPNIHLNVFESAASEDEHNHPWSTLSVMVKGSYVESINHKTIRETKALGFAYLSHKDSHRLVSTTPGTTTFFMHGFRRHGWKFHMVPHEVPCDFCVQNNGGKCMKKAEVLNYEEYNQRGDGPQHGLGKIRTMAWRKVDAEFRRQLERRRAAVEKLGAKAPDREEGVNALRDIMFQRLEK